MTRINRIATVMANRNAAMEAAESRIESAVNETVSRMLKECGYPFFQTVDVADILNRDGCDPLNLGSRQMGSIIRKLGYHLQAWNTPRPLSCLLKVWVKDSVKNERV